MEPLIQAEETPEACGVIGFEVEGGIASRFRPVHVLMDRRVESDEAGMQLKEPTNQQYAKKVHCRMENAPRTSFC
jgi:hypothetical protein